jgi:hypothetical protein
MRLGEKLVHDRLITVDQLEKALRSQVIYGGRLGTNLVELGFIELDALARALAEQKGVPAALEKHLQAIDPATLSLLPSRLAEKHQAIPIGLARLTGRQLVVSFIEPDRLSAIDEIGFATGSRITPCVAPEIRMMHYLEKLYGIPRKNRFLRIDRGTGVPTVERRRYLDADFGGGYSSEPVPGVTLAVEVPEPIQLPRPTATPRSTRDTQPELRVPTPPPGMERTASAPPAPLPISVALQAAAEAKAKANAKTKTNARQEPASQSQSIAGPALSLADALWRLAAATTRDEVGDTIVDHLRSAYACGLVLIAKEGVALGWKGFAPDCPIERIESLALPLTVPSMLRLAYEGKAVFRGAPPPDGQPIQQRLWKTLHTTHPAEVLVGPVVLKDRVVNVVYAHAQDGGPLPEPAAAEMAQICAAAATAFARLIKQKKQ